METTTTEDLQDMVEVTGEQRSSDTDKVVSSDAVSQFEIDLLKREIELLKREKLLLEKEKNLEYNTPCSQLSNGSNISDIRADIVRMGIHEIKTLISEFNPTTDKISAKSWLESIESLKGVYGWDDKNTLFYATLRLGGAAAFWYQSQQNALNTFEEFKKELLESFPSSESDTTVLMKIMERKRLPYEPIEDYVYQVAALAKKIRLDEASIIKYIISGLSDQNLINVLMATNCENISHLLLMVKNFEEVQKQGQTRKNLFEYKNEPSTSRNFKNNFFYKRYQTDKSSSKNKQREDNKRRYNNTEHFGREKKVKLDNMQCFKCNGTGHYARDCTVYANKTICYRCQQIGHIAKDCKVTNFKRISTLNRENHMLPLRDEYHKIVCVEGKRILAFFDLGSDCSTIIYEEVNKNNWEIMRCDTKLVGFGNKQTGVLGKINKIVTLGNIEIPIDIMVVENYVQNVPMIIGRNFMDRPNIEIIKRWGIFEIVRKEENREQKENRKKTSIKNLEVEDIQINSEVGEEQKIMLINLINEYRECFAKDLSELGKTELEQMKIELKEQKVIRYQPYKVAYGLKSVLSQQIQELLELDVIQSSTSEYASPVLLVPKKNGDYRMCVDYRKLNAITKRETFPVPNIEETLNLLANKKIFTTLDLLSGYHQVPIDKGSQHLTAFITAEGHYEFKRVPFGLTNSPAVFMRLMKKIVQPIGTHKIISFMDDILIPSKTIEGNLEILTLFLIELKKAGLTLNLKKCDFFKKEICFLGHEISAEGIKPGSVKTLAIKNYKRPENAREVKQFLGLTGYFRRFIRGFSYIALPLNKLLRKDVEFEWTKECEQSFNKLKELLSQRPILALYDENAAHEVHTDASSHGIAGILMQQCSGDFRPVSYFSRATTQAESKYHSYELEALAVVEALERFKHYLLHRRFKVVTDCNSLRQTQEKKDLIPRIARWWLKISEFDFELVFRPASKMIHADALSRCPVEEGKEGENVSNKILVVAMSEDDWLAVLQKEDPRILEIQKVLSGEILEHQDKNGIKGNFVLQKGRVFKITPHGNCFVIPTGIRWKIIKSAHDDRGHPGVERTTEILRKYVWFPSMKAVIKKYVASCIDCLYNKRGEDETRYVIHSPERQAIPFHTIHLDHLGPYPKSKKQNMYLIGMVDSFSKYIILKPTKTANSKGVLKLLEEMTQYFGVATRIITDRGTAFTSKEFEKYCHENSIKHILTTVKTPRSNGQVERYFRTVKTAINTMTQDPEGRDWDAHISSIQWALNSFKNTTTKVAPHQLILTYQPRDILQNKLLLALHDNIDQENEENMPLSELKEKILERMSKTQQQQAEKFNATHKSPRKYKKGDLVLIKQESVATGQPRKVQPRFKGPYVIKAVLENDRYVVADTEELRVTRKPYESVQSAERLKPWCHLQDLDFDNHVEDDENREIKQ